MPIRTHDLLLKALVYATILMPAAVAEFGLLLRGSKFKSKATYANCLALARQAVGGDYEGHRAEFIRLVEKTESLKQRAD